MTVTMTNGTLDFNGAAIELGKAYKFNGRVGTPFMAWVRGANNMYSRCPNTSIRVKFGKGYGQTNGLLDFNTLDRVPVVIEEMGA